MPTGDTSPRFQGTPLPDKPFERAPERVDDRERAAARRRAEARRRALVATWLRSLSRG